MIVMKFGGSSVRDAEAIRRVAKLVRQQAGRAPIVVTSAHEGVTDLLAASARRAVEGAPDVAPIRERHTGLLRELGLEEALLEAQLQELEVLLTGISMVKELTPRTLDSVLSFGERFAARTLAAYFTRSDLPATAVDAYDLGLRTDSNYGNARPLPESDEAIAQKLRRIANMPVVTGFIGKDRGGVITTLGRNGSDYTATIVGSALGAEEVQLWTDVDGVMTADPSLFPAARPIKQMSFLEAGELAYYGVRVLHPMTLIPAVRKGIPVRVLNTYRPRSPGTVIVNRAAEQPSTKAIVYKKDLFLINMISTRMLMHHGFMQRIFESFGKHRIVIDMISTSEVSVSLTTDTDENLEQAVRELSEVAEVTVEAGKAVVCVVGEGLREHPDVVPRVFDAVRAARVSPQMISYGATRINVAFLIDDEQIEPVVAALHREFFGCPPRACAAEVVAGEKSRA